LLNSIEASLDEPSQTVVMHRTEPTKLQTLALQLSEKITTLMDQTERMIQIKGGEMSAFFTRNQRTFSSLLIIFSEKLFNYLILFNLTEGPQSQQNQQQNAHRDHKQQNWNKQSKEQIKSRKNFKFFII
jgi:hypothetical protein